MEPRFPRVQQPVSRAGRALPGMSLEFDDSEADDEPRPRKRFRVNEESKAPWWRPVTPFGRALLGVCALTVLATLTASGILLKQYLERDGRFRIQGASAIQATGLTEVSRSEMLPVFGEDIGRNIFFVPLEARRKQLESISWVKSATVMRILPDQIRVSIVERQPVAFTRQGAQIGLVDASGVLLSMPVSAMAKHHYSFPVVTGIDGRDTPEARKTRMEVYLRLMADLDSTGKHYTDQISEIDLTDPEDARVLMPEQGTDILAHFGEDHFLERFERYQAHIAEWRQQYPKLSSVDLRYDQQVVLQMASGKQDAATDVGAAPAADATSAPSAAKPAAKQGKADESRKKPSAAKKAAQKTSARSATTKAPLTAAVRNSAAAVMMRGE